MRTKVQAINRLIFNFSAVLFIIGVLGAQVSKAATYHVGKSGTNTNTCSQAQSQSTPKLTIQAGIGCLSAGDTLQIHAGTYHEDIGNSNGSFGYAVPSGTAGSPITIMGYPGDAVPVIDGDPSHTIANQPTTNVSILSNLDISYWTIGPNLKFDGRSGAVRGGITINESTLYNIGNIITGVELTGSAVNEIFIGANGVTVMNSKIHDGGQYGGFTPPYGYCIYDTGANGVIDGNDCYGMGGNGMQFYSALFPSHIHDTIIRNNKIHGNTTAGVGTAGISLGGYNMSVYNNVIYGNLSHGINAQCCTDGKGGNIIYNNTITGNSDVGITLGDGSGEFSPLVKNNIIYNNTNGTIFHGASWSCSVGGGSGCESNNLTANPGFVNPSTNFHLSSDTSPAVGNGMDLAGIVNTDADGVLRGSSYDIGAYQYIKSLGSMSPPSNFRLVP